jgi:hypothetical protein
MAKKSKYMVVVFSDIVNWSTEDANKQALNLNDLNNKVKIKLNHTFPDKKPLWIASTGDGFGIGFSGDECEPFLKAIFEAFQDISNNEEENKYKIRMGAYAGLVIDYVNELTGKNDVCGPGVIYARRLLDACEPGWFLIDNNLAESIIGIDKSYWEQYFLDAFQYTVKHDKRLTARRIVPTIDTQGFLSKVNIQTKFTFTEIVEKLGSGMQNEINQTSKKLSTRLLGVNQFLIHWVDTSCKGLAPDAVKIEPFWNTYELAKTGLPNDRVLN